MGSEFRIWEFSALRIVLAIIIIGSAYLIMFIYKAARKSRMPKGGNLQVHIEEARKLKAGGIPYQERVSRLRACGLPKQVAEDIILQAESDEAVAVDVPAGGVERETPAPVRGPHKGPEQLVMPPTWLSVSVAVLTAVLFLSGQDRVALLAFILGIVGVGIFMWKKSRR